MMKQQSIITLNNVSKVFHTDEVETHALADINLEINSGEFISISGPSGCGKSTLLNIVGMLDNPTEGRYQFAGHEVAGLKERQRTQLRKGNLGFVFQSFNLIDELTVFENVELPLIYLKMSKSERREKVMAVLERMKIAHRAKHFPQQLSGGQQQRVAIARALASDPKLLLADEPTGALDMTTSYEIMEFLQQLNDEGKTLLIVTHEEDIAAMNKFKIYNGKKGISRWICR